MPTPQELRELFMLDPSVVFLNHGSFGTVPHPVFEAQERLRRELEAEPVLFLARGRDERLDAVRAADARPLGALTVVRVSVQGYTSDDDCRALVDALTAL